MTSSGSPFVVALSGGIASGKSAASDNFAALGVVVVDTDLLAREVVAVGSEGLRLISAEFGDSIVDAGGELRRARLREIVFSNDVARRRLESIVHPRIRELAEQRLAAVRGDYAILVVPLLAENFAAYDWVSRVLVVDVSVETQLQRLMQRDGATLELAQSMLAAQASREQRLAIADDVLVNEGSLEQLRSGVAALHQRYLQMARLPRY